MVFFSPLTPSVGAAVGVNAVVVIDILRDENDIETNSTIGTVHNTRSRNHQDLSACLFAALQCAAGTAERKLNETKSRANRKCRAIAKTFGVFLLLHRNPLQTLKVYAKAQFGKKNAVK